MMSSYDPTSIQPRRDQALSQIHEAFENFKSHLSRRDEYEFKNTALKDVWKAVGEVEKRLAARGESRSFRRLKSLLDGLQHYSGPIEVLCNGTMYLPWIWAPIKLCIQIAADHISALEKLIKAYADIGDALPRFDRLGSAFKDQSDFHMVLATVYTDIIEFHQRAYKLFTDNAWKRFFNTSWTRFDNRFTLILESLKRHSELVDKEANAMHIALLQDWRRRALDELIKTEKERAEAHFRAVITWFAVRDFQQEDLLDSLVNKCHTGTGDWFLQNTEVNAFIGKGSQCPSLWVTGKPGSGKSVLCAQLIRHLQQQKEARTAYYLCSMRTNSQHGLSQILRSIAAQLARQDQRCAAYTYDEYVNSGRPPSIQHLKSLIPSMLSTIPLCRIIIDGIDECSEKDQKEILSHVLALCDNKSGPSNCKLAVFSQDVPAVRRLWKRQTCVSLSDMKSLVDESIKTFVHQQLDELRQNLDMEIPNSMMEFIEQAITSKADGMFLWVRLVLTSLQNTYSLQDLREAVGSLPNGIDEAYGRILHRIKNDRSADKIDRVIRVFSWILMATRPLKLQELLDGVSFCTPPFSLDVTTKLRVSVIDLCKPLVDVSADGVVSMVHFSAKQYLLDHMSGPFLTKQKALQCITLGCTAYVKSSLDLIDHDIPELQQIESVALGFHNLHGFANAHWLDYVVQLAKERDDFDLLTEQPIERTITEMCRRHNNLLVEIHPSQAKDSLQSRQYPRSDSLKRHRLLCGLASNTWEDERALSEQQRKMSVDQASTQRTRTLWSSVSLQYESIVARLLNDNVIEEFPEVQRHLPTFRSLYAAKPFSCRVASCPFKSEGFPDQIQKERHERSHWARLMCREPSCSLSTSIGFASAKQLDKHMKRYHANERSEMPVFADFLPTSNPETPTGTSHESGSYPPSHQEQSNDLIPPITRLADTQMPYDARELEEIGNALGELDLSRLPSRFKIKGSGWNAVFNPNIPRELDVSLVKTIQTDCDIYCMHFNPDASLLAVGCDSVVIVYDTTTWSSFELWHIAQHHPFLGCGPIYSTAFSADSYRLATGEAFGTLRVWSVISRSVLHEVRSVTVGVSDLTWLDDNRIICIFDDVSVGIWILTDSVFVSQEKSKKKSQTGFNSIAMSQKLQMPAAGSDDGDILYLDAQDGTITHKKKAHSDAVMSVHFTDDQPIFLVSSSFDHTIKLWNPITKICYRTITGHSDYVGSVKTTACGRWIVSGSGDCGIHFWDRHTGIAHVRINGHKRAVGSVDVMPRSQRFATASSDGQIRIWEYSEHNQKPEEKTTDRSSYYFPTPERELQRDHSLGAEESAQAS